MKKSITIIVIITIIILSIMTIFLMVKDKSNSNINKLNNNPNVIKEQTLENLKIRNVTITIDNNKISTFSADVTNMSDTENKIETIDIILKDKKGNILTTLAGYIGVGLKKGDVSKINATTEIDLSKATSVEYKRSNN